MNCPCCGKDMMLGYIYNGNQPVQWIPHGKKPSAFAFSTAEGGVPLQNRFEPIKSNGYKAEAFYCGTCKLVVAPTK